MATFVYAGPWGGSGGNSFSFIPPGSPPGKINQIVIRSGDAIDSISFTFTDTSGRQQTTTFGGGGGSNSVIIPLAANEVITGISGTFGLNGANLVITSLSITTNTKTSGPHGQVTGTTFSLPITRGNFVGFFGRSGTLIDSLGAILLPA